VINPRSDQSSVTLAFDLESYFRVLDKKLRIVWKLLVTFWCGFTC